MYEKCGSIYASLKPNDGLGWVGIISTLSLSSYWLNNIIEVFTQSKAYIHKCFKEIQTKYVLECIIEKECLRLLKRVVIGLHQTHTHTHITLF